MNSTKLILFLTRVGFGWVFFYAGITKVINPDWSAAGYLNNAKTFSGFYQTLASDSILPLTNFFNEWGLTIIGIMLILGLGTRLAAKLGAIMMILYYFPVLDFPKIGTTSYIVDEHILYALSLLLLSKLRAGRAFGLDDKLSAKRGWSAIS